MCIASVQVGMKLENTKDKWKFWRVQCNQSHDDIRDHPDHLSQQKVLFGI